jgi:hypothetical protein
MVEAKRFLSQGRWNVLTASDRPTGNKRGHRHRAPASRCTSAGGLQATCQFLSGGAPMQGKQLAERGRAGAGSAFPRGVESSPDGKPPSSGLRNRKELAPYGQPPCSFASQSLMQMPSLDPGTGSLNRPGLAISFLWRNRRTAPDQ